MRGTLAQLVAAIPGARMTADASFDSVSTDSRSAGAGALFVALRGETFDAHDFLAQVAAAGAVAVVVDSLPQGWTLPAIVVPDTLVALGRIAHHWRAQFDLPVIGVTGSNGKTTVKEMIAAILAAGLSEETRLATRGNLNNEIGVPLTLMRLSAAHKAAVIELGMNHPGEIARLAAIAAPTIGLVNNAQREHQEFMHTVEAVARENGAVLAGLAQDGVAVFPGDDEYTPLWQGISAGRRTITFGLDAASNVSCVQRAADFGSELDVTVRIDGAPLRTFNVKLAAAGLHNVRNALAAIACTMAAGVAPDVVARGLAAFEPVSGRLQRKQAACGATVIDDTYNANPDSVRAAIDVLAQAGQPRILVLGDMGEVGTQGREFHEEIGAYAAARGVDTVLVTGELTRHMAASGARHYTQFDELLAALDTQLGGTSDATVLVKGSRFMKMERVVAHLVGSHNTSKEAH
ncbi:UDP-N-acetylmuramoyl-tripeptide--D-alanyl-D-alanine ligase [Massilia antarctica]|uniref:UDP-N-acetylmuramoyl-tripeptide--D-alanyl-D-alanine ligase n=1 Tax=Massilia antarctica TaxID=2765360 RepID=A0AA49AB87_9BURK|nr:UDP-N-acetylmuramoyl-tripeptide--D-alanyl-D-alanine ligase [Massilia antarctica]QPI52490.1 UDP-N-acetylmuramoyl-tripeptide--D-alanyl-D-alanine ligase [Massilia antarctica]